MKKLLFVLLFMSGASLFAQPEALKKDLVTEADGKYTIEDYTMLKDANGNSLQVKASATVKANDFISRDQFVAFFYMILSELMQQFAEEGFTESEDLEELIGNPDITINMYMVKSGIQIEIITDNGKQRVTKKWSEFLNY